MINQEIINACSAGHLTIVSVVAVPDSIRAIAPRYRFLNMNGTLYTVLIQIRRGVLRRTRNILIDIELSVSSGVIAKVKKRLQKRILLC